MNAIVNYKHIVSRVATRAYYKYIDGYTDAENNWYTALAEELAERAHNAKLEQVKNPWTQ